MPPVTQRFAKALLSVLNVIAIAPAVFAAGCEGKCSANEVLVGEDTNACYCKDRVECVRDAGLQWRTDRGNCAYSVQGVFASSGQGLADSALECVVYTLGNGGNLRGA